MKTLFTKSLVAGLCATMFNFSTIAQEWSGIAVPPSAGNGKKWELQAAPSDDFNYNFNATTQRSNFGGNKWYNFYHNGWDGPGTTYWQHNHTAVNGDNLVLRASRNWNTTKMGVPGINAGCITSNNKVKYPVYVEASVSVANIALASDVWLLSPDDTQEIDIIECYGGAGSNNAFFAQFIHLSHHSFIRSPFTDYQPRDYNSWWPKSGVTSFGEYCWNNGNRRYVRIGVNWIGPKHFEYYIDGELVRVLYDKAFATKKGGVWYYTYPTNTNGNLNFSNGYQTVVDYATTTVFSFQTLQNASNSSNTSVIDPYNFQGGNGFTKELDIIINVESQDWHVADGRTPSDADLADPAKNKMLVDWIRVYKPVNDTPTTGATVVFQAESYTSTGGTINDAPWGGPGYGVNKTTSGINWVNSNDYIQKTIYIGTAGTYSIDYNITTPSNNAQVKLIVDGQVKATDNVPNTGTWNVYKSLVSNNTVYLSKGNHTFKVLASGSNTWQWNLDKVTFKTGNARLANESSSNNFVAKEIRVYPNPASAQIDFTGVETANIEIFNLAGEKVLSTIYQAGKPINLNGFNKGVYMVSVSEGTNHQMIRLSVQ